MATENSRVARLEGKVEKIEFKQDVRGKEFVAVSILQDGLEYPTTVRSRDASILDRMSNAKAQLDAGETVHLGVEVRETPMSNGQGYFRDIIQITSASIGDVAQEPPTPGSSTSAAPTSAPDDGWGTIPQRIAWNSAINNAISAMAINNPSEYWVGDIRDARDIWLPRVDGLASLIYPLILRGPLPPEEDTPDADQPGESDDGVFEA